MKKRLAFFLSLFFLVGASKLPVFRISGVYDELLQNIKSRLTEFNQSKPLAIESDESLRHEIEAAMQPFGYFKPQIKLKREPLEIDIKPGPQLLISSLHFRLKGEGASNFAIKKDLTKLPLKQGEPFNSLNYEKAKQNLIDAAEKQGYLHSFFEKSEILIDSARGTAEIILIFNTGARFYFGQVQFDPSYLSPELLQRYIPFHAGEPYSADQILTFNNQLASSGYFRRLSVTPQIGDKSFIPIDVHFKPVKRLDYSLGAGYGTDTGIRARAGFHIVPVNPGGHKFNALAIGSFNQSSLQALYSIPGNNPVTDEYHLSANFSVLNYDSGYSESALASISQHHRLNNYQRVLSLNGLYDGFHYTNHSKERNFTLFPKASFTWLNTKENLFSPTGYSVRLSMLGASRFFGSEQDLSQLSLNVKAALTVDSIRTRFYFHSIQGLTLVNDINRLPLSLALFLGGSDNLKAFKYNTIGPGKILSYGGLEIQKETFKNWYLLGFYDSGDVYLPKTRDFKKDLGLGLMWVSPIGPIKIGVAQAVDSHFHREKGLRIIVNMGPDL